MFFPPLGMGIGLRTAHYAHLLERRPSRSVQWFEAVSENYMGIEGGAGGRPLHVLEAIRKDFPVVLHGVSLSIGSVDPLNASYLRRLRELTRRIEPAWISDHLCWTGVGGENLHDLLPLPYTEEAIRHVVARVARVQDRLGRRILLENVSSYLEFRHSEMAEWDFLSEIARRADCGILLDVNNIYVSSVNHGFDPVRYLDGIPPERVGQMHLSGHSVLSSEQGRYLIDTHDHPISDPVWALYEQAVRRFGAVSTLIEWDDKIPEFQVLEAEAARARKLQEKVLGSTHAGGKKRAKPSVARPAAELVSLDHHRA